MHLVHEYAHAYRIKPDQYGLVTIPSIVHWLKGGPTESIYNAAPMAV